jgi:N-carbamoylputrescine amidase
MITGEPNAESRISVACLQMRPEVGAKPANVDRGLAMISEAAAAGAGLVVLPELCNSGYVFATRAEAFKLAEEVPNGPTTRAWAEAAATYGIYVVAGVTEREGDALYNSAVLVGPNGFVGKHRKNHLWFNENLFFEQGNLGMPVFRTPVGRIAVAICYDVWFPETFRLAALRGADILCVPTNWVPMPGQRPDLPAMANILCMAGAHSNSLFVAAADRVGTERGQPFIGQSLIVGPDGWPVGGPASADQEETVVAEVNLSDARRVRNLNAFNQVLRDRRTDVYDEMLGTSAPRAAY